MAGGRDLGFPKTSSSSLREQLARTTLHTVRSQGHPYVDLREDGKRFIFFCTLCLAPCYSDSVLFEHLKGNLHKERLSGAKVTLFGPNPWPFKDGVLFFDNSTGNETRMTISDDVDHNRLLEYHKKENNLAIVKYGENLEAQCNGHDGVHSTDELSFSAKNLNSNEANCDLVIPGALIKEKVSDLKVRFTGFGQIAARFLQKDDSSDEISRIWCEWLGENGPEDMPKSLEHDFAIVTFAYYYDLGRKGLLEDMKSLLPSSPLAELENGEGNGRKRKKSFSDPEDISESLGNQYDSSEEGSAALNGSSSRLLLDRYDDQLLHTRFISSKSIRRELRRQQRILAERMCDICQQKMLPEKDVAAIVNVKTGKLACSSRNVNGAFHVFHTSCLIHWFLLCELEIITNQSVNLKRRRRSRKKSGAKCSEMKKNGKTNRTQIFSVFCPECQGTGINVEGDELERPIVPLSQMFRYKIKVSDARKAWMKNPEVLLNCSTGFHFPSQLEGPVQEKVSTLKLLRFYSVDE